MLSWRSRFGRRDHGAICGVRGGPGEKARGQHKALAVATKAWGTPLAQRKDLA